jgi:hypothetical protein
MGGTKSKSPSFHRRQCDVDGSSPARMSKSVAATFLSRRASMRIAIPTAPPWSLPQAHRRKGDLNQEVSHPRVARFGNPPLRCFSPDLSLLGANPRYASLRPQPPRSSPSRTPCVRAPAAAKPSPRLRAPAALLHTGGGALFPDGVSVKGRTGESERVEKTFQVGAREIALLVVEAGPGEWGRLSESPMAHA